jgi:biopolymer transport protein ExbD
MRHAQVNEARMPSPLQEAMLLNPKRGTKKRKMVVGLVLTSLVDAFSIMLLYLLTQNTGNGSSIEMNKAESLPTAIKTEALHAGTMVRIENNRYYLGEQPVEIAQLAMRLQEVKATASGEKAENLIIQADKTMDFSLLAPVIRAGSISGFNKFKFAVLQDEGSAAPAESHL